MTSPYVSVAIKCAHCGAVRGASNHWFVLRLPDGEAVYVYQVRSLNPAKPPMSGFEFPACGESCLQKLESKILSGEQPCAA